MTGGLLPALQRDGSFVTPPLTLRWYKKTVPQSRLYRRPGDGILGPHATVIAWGEEEQSPRLSRHARVAARLSGFRDDEKNRPRVTPALR